MTLYLLLTVNSITFGGLLFLLSAGFSLIFGLMRIPNLTHGSLFMLGAYFGATFVGGMLAIVFDFWLAAAIAAKGPLALRYVKEAVLKGMDLTLEQGLRLEADLYFLLHTTSDRTEGIRSYLEKRDPEYRGE